MNREQARREIDSLDYYLQNHTDDYGEESHTAMMMAIKALEQQPCEDAIRREAAIDAMYHHFCDKSREECAQILHEVPSVNPQANKEDIHRERDELLDKIRTEIDGLTYYWCEVNPRSVIDDVLKIIDKYKGESEVQDDL